MKYLFLVLLVSLQVGAQVKVHVVDPQIDSTPLEKNYQVTRDAKSFNAIPDMDERDQLLDGVKETKSWDHLKKDIFYMDLKSKTQSELEKKYPELKKEIIQTLKAKRG